MWCIIISMEYGYPTKFGFGTDLLSEIEFAKKYFDFLEITLEIDSSTLDLLPRYSQQHVEEIRNATKNFLVFGHFDFDINPFEYTKEIGENIEILEKLGIQKLTVHPYEKSNESFHGILDLLLQINKICEKNKIQLCVENNSSGTFSRASEFAKLIDKIPNAGMTLDIGHANKTSESELDLFLKMLGPRIQHFHIHNNKGKIDHLPFENEDELKNILEKISSVNYGETATLETHCILKNNQSVYLNTRDKIIERRNLFLEQLKMIKQ